MTIRLVALFAISIGGIAQAENRFVAVNRAIAPLLAILTDQGSDGNRAIEITGWLRQEGNEQNAPMRIAYEFPDKLLLQFPFAAATATICRDGQHVWAAPATLFAPLLSQVAGSGSTTPLPPLKVERKKAVLLPALLDVRDGGSVEMNGESYHVFDLRPVTEVVKKSASTWPVRLWTRAKDNTPAQLTLRFSGWAATIAIEKIELRTSLPPNTWQPTAGHENESVEVPGDKIVSLFNLALGRAAK